MKYYFWCAQNEILAKLCFQIVDSFEDIKEDPLSK